MTATASETALDVPVDVRFTAAGNPLAVRYDGRVWAVAAEPLHWFTRDSWWEPRRSAPVGVGNIVDIEFWRVQVKLSANSALRTFLLRRNPVATQWLLESIS
ncbi:hypothetical protein AHiyo8_pI66090 (plasmid) [Arthrobacter sp. Hiyo8]|uniref:hypothetical protein n=1 Tax=Arthrobacter sp. Hiyo1 TaxID=1588020 RepID=UPI000683AC73|nr:hypothetical protein [Arthrobacter sp. Hiyo1]BAS18305.1 hypothetical protein AHiyo8_pI66090 [Arthrobacter sp. Hiyo8]GAP60837.1 hypothetical protein AHiyo1_44360 [Arthrobacter sp. Hiyo1]